MAFTEFCCRSGGSNLNAGTRTGSSTEPDISPDFTYSSGSWASATGVFTVASGNPSTDGVAINDWASVYDPSNFLYLSGSSGGLASTPDAAALHITGDIDLRAKIGTMPASGAIVTNSVTGANSGFTFGVGSTTALNLALSNGASTITASGTFTPLGTPYWVRATWRASDGRVQFFTSPDGVTWTQVDTDKTIAIASINSLTNPIQIGERNSAVNFAGNIYRVQIYNGIAGTKVFDADFSAQSPGTKTFTESSSNAATVTINGGAGLTGSGLYLPGITGNYASISDSPALSITGNIDIRLKINLASGTQMVIAKDDGGSNREWAFLINTAFAGTFTWWDSGGTIRSAASTGSILGTFGTTSWIRVTLKVDNGSSNHEVRFYTSPDGTTWTQQGGVFTAGTNAITSIRDLSAPITIGASANGATNPTNGTFYRVQIRNNVLNDGTGIQLDADFSTQLAGLNNFIESSGNAGLVVVNTNAAIRTIQSTGFVGRITAVSSTTITVSLTAKSGTPPPDGTSNRTLRIGGAWKGPNGSVGFPFGFVAATMMNVAGDIPRINLKNSATYSITATMLHILLGPVRVQGYTSAYGDLGKATIDGGTTGTSYSLLAPFTNRLHLYDLIFQNNGATGSVDALLITFNSSDITRVVVNNVRGNGFGLTSGANNVLTECEAYACNQSNTANLAGFSVAASGNLFRRCISHDNAGNNSAGFRQSLNGITPFIHCIADSNGGHGWNNNGSIQLFIGCDAYNNGGSGIFTNATELFIQNCNLVKNGAYGIINSQLVSAAHGSISNCGFGSGTQANVSGQISGQFSIEVTGTVTYPADVTPWQDPANGDFRIVRGEAKATGRGVFTQTQAGYAGTVAYPDIGAAQSRGGGISRGRLVNA